MTLPVPPARPPLRARTVTAVAVGGALGALLRVLVGEAWPVDGFPWSTLAVNVSGSAALAALPALAVVRRRPLAAPFLGTGLLGGYTTLSTASAETLDLGPVAAAAYVVLTLAACLAAVTAVDQLTTPAERAAVDRAEGDL